MEIIVLRIKNWDESYKHRVSICTKSVVGSYASVIKDIFENFL